MDASTPNAAQPKSRRSWYQYTLRTLLIVVTAAGCGLGWLGWKVREARQQQAAVAAILKLGGRVSYDYQFDAAGSFLSSGAPPGPEWLHALLGDDFFRSVYQIDFLSLLRDSTLTDANLERLKGLSQLKELFLSSTHVTDAGLEHLKGLTNLEVLALGSTRVTDAGLQYLTQLTKLEALDLNCTQVSDAGLERLKGLTRLKELSLQATKVTPAGVAELQKALPNCHIDR